jgi:diketogulonate reductase-like aldo/keto reductase
MQLPKLGMGTWGMGGKFERDDSNAEESVKALRYGLDLGIKLIDTAEIYGNGLTEEIVGEAISGYKREELFIATKVWKTNLSYSSVLKAAAASLQRLQTDYIDLYLVHWPNPDIPLSATLRALEELKKEKIIKHIGVSNFSIELLEQARSYLQIAPMFANQIEYNLSNREEEETVKFCQDNDIYVIAYRPLAKGLMEKKYQNTLKSLSEKYHKTLRQIMLNWLMSRNIIPIPKAANFEHIDENYGALGWHLEEADVELLNNY